MSTLAEHSTASQVRKVELICQRYKNGFIFWPLDNFWGETLNLKFMYSNFTDHSRNLMSSEGSKIEQIGTQKSEISALVIEGIHPSRFQN